MWFLNNCKTINHTKNGRKRQKKSTTQIVKEIKRYYL